MSVNAYQRAGEMSASPRDNEYRAFGMVINRLTQAQNHTQVVEACHLNNRLWSTLTADLSRPENPLPTDLKARLISLALWSYRHSAKVMRGDVGVQALVDLNREIMSGLRGQDGGPTDARSAA
jgi:flagellar protein FlaF